MHDVITGVKVLGRIFENKKTKKPKKNDSTARKKERKETFEGRAPHPQHSLSSGNKSAWRRQLHRSAEIIISPRCCTRRKYNKEALDKGRISQH
jgi:hypothetical protein